MSVPGKHLRLIGQSLLRRPHSGIFSASGQQLLMSAGLRNVPACYHQDLIRISDDRQGTIGAPTRTTIIPGEVNAAKVET